MITQLRGTVSTKAIEDGSADFIQDDFQPAVRKGFRYDPILGFINTRDPWWLHAWMIVFWAALGALAVLSVIISIKPN